MRGVALNVHHRRAMYVLFTAVALDVVLGLVFAAAQHVSAWEGLYYATGTALTVGADIAPHGWLPHALTVAMEVTVLPLFASVLALVTTGLTADHVDTRHEELKQKLGSST